MTLAPVTHCTSISSFNTTMPLPLEASQEIMNATSTETINDLTWEHVSIKTDLFVSTLQQQASKEGKKVEVNSLSKIFHRITREEDDRIKQALNKPNGYLYRLFSNESWTEWVEQRTALGRVVNIFKSYIESGLSLEDRLPSHLSDDTITQAVIQAKSLLQQLNEAPEVKSEETLHNRDSANPRESDCSTGLILGAVGTVATQNPLPIGIASLNCLEGVQAVNNPVRYNGVVTLQPRESWYMDGHHKIVLCKKSDICDYPGLPLKVTIINTVTNAVLHNGPFNGKQEFNTARKEYCIFQMRHVWNEDPVSILIENEGRSESSMHVYVE